MIILDDYGQPDYEAMILERQEHYDFIGNCDGDCKRCEAAEECSALWPTPDSKYLDPLKHTPWDPTEE